MLRALAQAARPLAHANIAPPILLGQAIAFALEHRFDWRWAIAAHLFGALDHLMIVLANDYADRDADRCNTTFNVFSGGSRAIVEGRLPPRLALWLAIAAGAILFGGSLLAAPARPLAPVFAASAVFLLWAYSYPPLELSYRGGGEWLQALGVGVVLPLLGFHAQAPDAQLPLLPVVPTFVLGFAGNLLTALPDEPADRAAGKRTWPVRRGGLSAARVLLLLTALGIVLGPLCLPLGSPIGSLVSIAIPLAMLGTALPFLPTARPAMREALLRFMLAAGGAGSLAVVIWTIAMFAR